jgi:hypothetical protein
MIRYYDQWSVHQRRVSSIITGGAVGSSNEIGGKVTVNQQRPMSKHKIDENKYRGVLICPSETNQQ